MQQLPDSYLTEEVQDFLLSHEKDDVQKLLLKQKTTLGVPTEWIAQQLMGRRKARTKLDTWYRSGGIVYPPSLNLEQSSSEATGKFKATILEDFCANKEMKGVDLTGGFGIDTFFLSQKVHHIDCVEPNGELLKIAEHNHRLLAAENISYHHSTAEAFIHSTKQKFDFVYIDPSRRKGQQKTYRLTDSEPDIAKLQAEIMSKSKYLLVKTSPLLDLQQGFKELKHAIKIYVVAVENECRELLFLLQNNYSGVPSIHAINLDRAGEIISNSLFTLEGEANAVAKYSSPLTYLYEPNAAIMKAGAFKWVAESYQLDKLAVSTHLYTADDQKKDFPGRIFRVLEFVKPDKKLKGRFVNGYANIITRNYPMSVEEVKKKTGLKDGGDQYLICTQDEKEKLVMIAERVK